MVAVTATTAFRGNEGEWKEGDTKTVSPHRAHELIEAGHVIEAREQPSTLQAVAGAIGATVAPAASPNLQPVAAALGAKVVASSQPIDEDKEKERKKEAKEADKRKTKEDKAEGLTKEAN